MVKNNLGVDRYIEALFGEPMKHIILICLVSTTCHLWAQPANDECVNATLISNVDNWCSAVGEYNNVGATTSGQTSGRCQLTGNAGPDVWFSFLAVGTDLNVRVVGAVEMMAGGTLTNPELVVYGGDCGSLAELGCGSDAFTDGIVELLLDQLTPGSNYFIRVSGRSGSVGSFQLCVNSFNGVPDPNADCPTGVVLCDKSSFVVQQLSGSGEIKDEASNSCLGENGGSESSSSWYKWVAGTDGSLSFTLTPSNPADDLDFAVYELPNGLDDCSDKILLRCMASGEQGGCDPVVWAPCTGPTGLRASSTDISESPGCNVNDPCVFRPTGQDDDNWVSDIQMEAGKVYALIVNNFSRSGSGFTIEFGGSGEFLGPQAEFIIDDFDGTICYGQPVGFFDQSSFGNLSLVDWQWNFGEGAVPQTLTGPGPHQVRYSTTGMKTIALTVESETGCLITDIGSLIVEEPFDIQAAIDAQSCAENRDGRIELTIQSGSNVTGIQWMHGPTGRILDSLVAGDYVATIRNFNGCDTTVQFTVDGPQPLEIESVLTRPSCGGGSNGGFTLVVSGQAPPFLYDFGDGNGFVASNSIDNLAAGIYPVTILDNKGCTTVTSVLLGEINVEIDSAFDAITPPTCFGFNNGRIDVRIIGGDPPFAYDFGANGSFQRDSFDTRISAGTNVVAIRDGNFCLGFIAYEVPEPPALIVGIDTTHISCFGEVDGTLAPLVSGGTPGYRFQWSNGGMDSLITALDSGQYNVTVTDAQDCRTVAGGYIVEPPFLSVAVDSTRDVVCFGDRTGVIYVSGEGGSPPFQYAVDGSSFQDSLFFTGLGGGSHTVTIRDDRGCTNTVMAQILQPEELIVDAGRDTSVDLGFAAQLLATHSPPNNPVGFQWFGGPVDCLDCPAVNATPLRTSTYVVMVTDQDNCMASDSVRVFIFRNRPIFVPNSITPNGDGYNDRLALYGGNAAMTVLKIQIFDRWGALVYEGINQALNDENQGWDGTHQGQLLNPGVFVYVAEVQFIDDSVLQFEGDITLIR